MPRPKGKKLIFLAGDLVDGLMKAASREGKPFDTFVEGGLRQVLRAHGMGYSQEELTRFLEVYQVQRESMTLIPLDVLNHLLGKAEKDQLQAKWHDAGVWYGKYLKGKVDQPVQALGRLLRATRWDLDEVDVKEGGGTVKFRCFSSTLSAEGTGWLREFIEGAMHGLGYKTEKEDSVKGIILLEFSSSR